MSDGTATGKTNQVLRLVMLIGGAVGLFSAGLVGTLGVRGKLNQTYLAPLVGLEPAEPSADELHAMLAENPRAAKADPPSKDPVTRAGNAAGRSQTPSYDLMPDVGLPSPFSAEETRDLFLELETARADLIERTARVAREQKDLELVRADLNHRWDELNRREQELEERSKSLDGERETLSEQMEEIDGRALAMSDVEKGNIQQLAKNIESMKAEAASALLAEKEPDQAALILSFIKAREAGKILAAMPPKVAADITERMLGILKPRAEEAQGGQ
jgi:flagellar motility protein MotE (MotC chaperone)